MRAFCSVRVATGGLAFVILQVGGADLVLAPHARLWISLGAGADSASAIHAPLADPSALAAGIWNTAAANDYVDVYSLLKGHSILRSAHGLDTKRSRTGSSAPVSAAATGTAITTAGPFSITW